MPEQIKQIFQRNILKKIVALILSIALWFFVMGSQDPVINGSYDIPISATNVPANYKAIFVQRDARVRLRAPRSYFVDYGANNVRAFVNMASYSTEGEYDVALETSFPNGFEIESIRPDQIRVKLDPIIERQISADVIVTGSPKQDLVVKGIEKSSNNLTLIGAKTAVNNVKRVIGYIGLSGNAETFDLPVPMTAIDEDGREVADVRVAPSVITVTVKIESDIIKKTVPIISDINLPPGREIDKVTISPENIEIIGKKDIIDAIDTLSTETLTIPVSTKTFTGKLKLILPDGVTVDKDEVDVTFEFKE